LRDLNLTPQTQVWTENIPTHVPELYLKKVNDAMFFCQIADFLWTSNKGASIMNENGVDGVSEPFSVVVCQ
jgi:hypothetical protein